MKRQPIDLNAALALAILESDCIAVSLLQRFVHQCLLRHCPAGALQPWDYALMPYKAHCPSCDMVSVASDASGSHERWRYQYLGTVQMGMGALRKNSPMPDGTPSRVAFLRALDLATLTAANQYLVAGSKFLPVDVDLYRSTSYKNVTLQQWIWDGKTRVQNDTAADLPCSRGFQLP